MSNSWGFRVICERDMLCQREVIERCLDYVWQSGYSPISPESHQVEMVDFEGDLIAFPDLASAITVLTAEGGMLSAWNLARSEDIGIGISRNDSQEDLGYIWFYIDNMWLRADDDAREAFCLFLYETTYRWFCELNSPYAYSTDEEYQYLFPQEIGLGEWPGDERAECSRRLEDLFCWWECRPIDQVTPAFRQFCEANDCSVEQRSKGYVFKWYNFPWEVDVFTLKDLVMEWRGIKAAGVVGDGRRSASDE